MLLSLTLIACSTSPDIPPESDGPVAVLGTWEMQAEARLVRGEGGLSLTREGAAPQLLAIDVLGAPAVSEDGRRAVIVHRDDGLTVSAIDALELEGDALSRRRLVGEGSPDRAAISADGTQVAYVSGITGIASIWIMPFEGGDAIQLTNQGLDYSPGEAPEGFVPPPHEGPLRFVEGQLLWTSPEGDHALDLEALGQP